ncbi:uncharacterized protein N7459_008193 [Penicillium hispanicum]|uniref:uncharacterized protein n=1 Tax=Penicillium hispanicum TaxID=1080232 RepID=UPI00254036D1|nr:uncharacterized protein N7459_008193 [Penicillium hispanicum]KAJ5573766.1 hypothetical protein N7459_008193 [Penicillium hispanicum]
MTESSQMQPTSQPMFSTDLGAGPPSSASHVETARSLDPHNSLEDYNRTMLEYTQRQMSSFVDLDDNTGRGSSSRSSQSSGDSGHSGASSNGVLARQANGAPPTSAGAAAEARHGAQQAKFKPARSPNETKPSGY